MSSLPACQREQPGHVGAHTPGHAMPQPDLDSDKPGVVKVGEVSTETDFSGFCQEHESVVETGMEISNESRGQNKAPENQPKLQGCMRTGFPSAAHYTPS